MNPVIAKESYETIRNTLSNVTYGPIVEVPRTERFDYTSYVAPDQVALLINLDEKALLATYSPENERPLHAIMTNVTMGVAAELRALFPGKTINCNSAIFRSNRHGGKDSLPYMVITCPRSIAGEVENLLEKTRYGEPFRDKPYAHPYTDPQKERVSYITRQLGGHVLGPCSAVPNDQAKTYVNPLGGDETFLMINLDGKSILTRKPFLRDPKDQRRHIQYYVDDLGGDIQELIGQIFPDTYIHREFGFHKYTQSSHQVDDLHQPYIGFICRTAYAPHMQSVIEDLIEQSRQRAASTGYSR